MADINTLPKELLLCIFEKVASHSIQEVCNVKMSCNAFLYVAKDDLVYKHASLDKFALWSIEWISEQNLYWHVVEDDSLDEDRSTFYDLEFCPLRRFNKERQLMFLKRCRESGNPTISYREGMIQYFQKYSSSSMNNKAMQKLKIFASNGPNEAKYVYCILLINSTDEERRNRGFDVFCSLKGTTELSICRHQVKCFIRRMWLGKERISIQEFSWCHSKKYTIEKHSYGPSAMDYNGNELGSWNTCAGCDADAEMRQFSIMTISSGEFYTC